MQQMVHQRIGRYEVICLLGEGGMAKVYLGVFRGPADVNKLVVLKQIRGEIAQDTGFITMFLDEARLATRLNHPNVVQTYEVLEDGEDYVLTMEYLEGQSLLDVFQRIDLQVFPLEEHLWILTQVLAGLQYAHALPDYDGSPLGVVHRDVAPANVFLTYAGDIKLLDFGIAQASGSVAITGKGIFKGKFTYCAPEQLEASGPVDARADLFAVGVMLWEALAGRRLILCDSLRDLTRTRLAGKEPRIREVCPDVDPALAEICDRAMALRPEDRYLTAVDFQRQLERYLEKSAKRVGRAELAELMQRHFEIERQLLRKRIEEHLTTPRTPTPAPSESPFRQGRSSILALREDVTHVDSPSAVPRRDGSFHEPTICEVGLRADRTPARSNQPQSLSLPVPAAASAGPVSPRGLQARSPIRWLLVAAIVILGGIIIAVGLWERGYRPAPRAAMPGVDPIWWTVSLRCFLH